jgi:hypothetical protein
MIDLREKEKKLEEENSMIEKTEKKEKKLVQDEGIAKLGEKNEETTSMKNKNEFESKKETTVIEKLKDNENLNVILAPDIIQISNFAEEKNIILEAKEIPPKPPLNFNFEKVKSKNISVKNEVKSNEKDIIPEQLIQKNEKGIYSVTRGVENPNLIYKIEEDEPKIKIPLQSECSYHQIYRRRSYEILWCHGKAIGNQFELIDNNMLEGDDSVKTKILSERKHYSENKPFKEKKETIEKFF